MGSPLQRPRPRLAHLPQDWWPRPPFTQSQVDELLHTVDRSDPSVHGLPGHLWTVKKLRKYLLDTFGVTASRSTIRNILRRNRRTFKKVKKLLSKANPDKRAAHIEWLGNVWEQIRRGEVILIYADEAHFHRDMDLGYSWGPIGKRIWRKSRGAKLSERLNCYGAYDFTNGECLLWQDGWCNADKTMKFLEAVKQWRETKKARVVLVWDNSPCHTAKRVKEKAKELGIELVNLPGYSPDLNPIERLWDWMRDELTRGHCYNSVAELTTAAMQFIQNINLDPVALVDRLWPVFELDPEFEAELRVSN